MYGLKSRSIDNPYANPYSPNPGYNRSYSHSNESKAGKVWMSTRALILICILLFSVVSYVFVHHEHSPMHPEEGSEAVPLSRSRLRASAELSASKRAQSVLSDDIYTNSNSNSNSNGNGNSEAAREGRAPLLPLVAGLQPVMAQDLHRVKTALPSARPSAPPSSSPTPSPSPSPTAAPTASPTAVPTASPTAAPTASPTAVPTAVPTAKVAATGAAELAVLGAKLAHPRSDAATAVSSKAAAVAEAKKAVSLVHEMAPVTKMSPPGGNETVAAVAPVVAMGAVDSGAVNAVAFAVTADLASKPMAEKINPALITPSAPKVATEAATAAVQTTDATAAVPPVAILAPPGESAGGDKAMPSNVNADVDVVPVERIASPAAADEASSSSSATAELASKPAADKTSPALIAPNAPGGKSAGGDKSTPTNENVDVDVDVVPVERIVPPALPEATKAASNSLRVDSPSPPAPRSATATADQTHKPAADETSLALITPSAPKGAAEAAAASVQTTDATAADPPVAILAPPGDSAGGDKAIPSNIDADVVPVERITPPAAADEASSSSAAAPLPTAKAVLSEAYESKALGSAGVAASSADTSSSPAVLSEPKPLKGVLASTHTPSDGGEGGAGGGTSPLAPEGPGATAIRAAPLEQAAQGQGQEEGVVVEPDVP
jgi:hypothetical protein